MTKYRAIHTKIWDDENFRPLTPNEKLLFIYLLANERTSESGIYQITYNRMAFDTGISMGKIQAIIKSGKFKNITYDDLNATVFIHNFLKYHGGGKKEALFKSLFYDYKFNNKSPLWEKWKEIYLGSYTKALESPDETTNTSTDQPTPTPQAFPYTPNPTHTPIPKEADSAQSSPEIPYERMLDIFKNYYRIKNGGDYANANEDLDKENAKLIYHWCYEQNPDSPLELFDERVQILVYEKNVNNFFALWKFWNGSGSRYEE